MFSGGHAFLALAVAAGACCTVGASGRTAIDFHTLDWLELVVQHNDRSLYYNRTPEPFQAA